MMQYNNLNRDTTLDLAKGFAILLVVLGHAIQFSFGPEYADSGDYYDDIVFKTIYSFHMPLFMLISGYLFYQSNKKDLKKLWMAKLKSIGLPLLTFAFVCSPYLYSPLVFNGDVVGWLSGIFTNIIHGYLMWFLLSLLLNICMLSILTRTIKKNGVLYSAILAVVVGSMFVPNSIIMDVHKFFFLFLVSVIL